VVAFSDSVNAVNQRLDDAEQARLRRILQRATADCEVPAATIGTGAQSTRKRALAVQLALDGAGVDAIAEAAALSPRRVGQVLSNVAEHGLEALYPAFAEPFLEPEDPPAGELEELLAAVLAKSPKGAGYDIGATWTPASLLGCLIQTGALEDSSIPRITEAIRTLLEQRDLNTVSFSWHDRWVPAEGNAPAWLASILLPVFFLVFVLIGVLSLRKGGEGALGGVVALLVATLAGCMWVYTVFRARQEKLFIRSMAAAAPETGTWRPAAEPGASAAVPPPPIVIRHVNALPRTPWSLEALSESSNAISAKPVSILYLWLFQGFVRHVVAESHGWPQLGPVHLLLSSAALNVRDMRRGRELLTEDRTELTAALGGFSDAPGLLPSPKLYGAGGKSYRGYPVHTLVCNDAIWQEAFHALAERSELAVFNLSGYTPNRAGIEYELCHVLRGGPPRSFVFMFDAETDADAAIDWVLRGWENFAGARTGSGPLIFLRYGPGQTYGYLLQFQRSRWGSVLQRASESEYHPVAGTVMQFLGAEVR
jgi:hypothetical protein